MSSRRRNAVGRKGSAGREEEEVEKGSRKKWRLEEDAHAYEGSRKKGLKEGRQAGESEGEQEVGFGRGERGAGSRVLNRICKRKQSRARSRVWMRGKGGG